MKHLLGAENGLLAKPNDRVKPQDMVWRDKGAIGKLDLFGVMYFRMV